MTTSSLFVFDDPRAFESESRKDVSRETRKAKSKPKRRVRRVAALVLKHPHSPGDHPFPGTSLTSVAPVGTISFRPVGLESRALSLVERVGKPYAPAPPGEEENDFREAAFGRGIAFARYRIEDVYSGRDA